ncbi:MAG TPA: VOC family protein [Crenalkalicoccus sp.]|jgi:catechol 2,3-dioxygenase-like lactoylglutathione lyase family enzyme|nr:VOC family protein [Crenalkalicoccus sp.]
MPHTTPALLDHLSIGVRDLAAARRFYDAALGAIGCRCLAAGESQLGYGRDEAVFYVMAVPRPVPADPESGLHVCFTAPDRVGVDAFHAAALAAGGRDNGAPGPRPQYSPDYYAAFVLDPEGYRIEAHCRAAA